MSTLKQAVQSGLSFVSDLIPDARDMRLEEVKPGTSGWRVVVSYLPSDVGLPQLIGMGGSSRVFKEVDIQDSGEATALYVWKP